MDKQLVIIYLIVNLIILNVINILLLEELQESGAELIVWIQYIRNDFLDYLFLIITELSVAIVVIGPVPIFLDHSIKYGHLALLTVFTAMFLDAVLKMTYAHPRPYVYDDDVFPVKCEEGYGDPSGHAALTSASYLFAAYLFSRNDKKIELKFILATVAIIIVGFDRLYMGAHTYYQVILGWSFGSLVVVLILSYQDQIITIIKKSRTNTKLLLILCAITAVILVIPIIILLEKTTDWNHEWTENIERVILT